MLDLIYLEPMVPVNQVRVMLFISQRLTIYDQYPVGRRGVGDNDGKLLVTPAYLERSM